MKFSFIWNFWNKKCEELSLTFFGTLKYHCKIKTIEMLDFLPSIRNSITIGFSFYYQS